MMPFTNAILRTPGANLGSGLTTTSAGVPDLQRALSQHSAYARALEVAGLRVQILESLPAYPDAYFVEDVAVITSEIAIICRPGALARRGEEQFIEPVLRQYRKTVSIIAPGTLDGGNVLIMGPRVLVGLTERTNAAGVEQLKAILGPFGYQISSIAVRAGLHFKSSVNCVAENCLILTPEFAGHPTLSDYRQIVVENADAYSANVLRVNDHLLIPAGYPRTRGLLEPLRIPLIELEVSEMRKMDGGLTCLSLRLEMEAASEKW